MLSTRAPTRAVPAVRTTRWITFVTVSTTFALVLSSCASLEGLTGGADDEPDARADADGAVGPDGESPCGKDLQSDHDNCGACGHTCGDLEYCRAGTCAPGCPGRVVYVSASGNDDGAGCSPPSAKRTISGALALLKTLGATEHEIDICRGVYEESVVLDHPTSLRGGFECATWKRTAGYGWPRFDGVNDTVIAGQAGGGPPLEVRGVSGVTVDGLVLRARDATGARSVGMLVTGAAHPVVTSSRVFGGGGAVAMSPASVGVLLDDASSLDMEGSVVDGGRAQNTTTGGYGSVGIHLTATAKNLRVDTSSIGGGAGIVSGGTGSVGVLGFGGSLAGGGIRRSSVHGGTGRTGTVGSATVGIGFFSGAVVDLEVDDSVIVGGAGSCGGTCSTIGLSARSRGTIRIRGNRVHGGNVDPDLVNDLTFIGVRAQDAEAADIQNNQIYSGNDDDRYSVGGTALIVSRVGDALVAGNTIALGHTRNDAGRAGEVEATTAKIVNNLFLHATDDTTNGALLVRACDDAATVLRGNAWVGSSALQILLRVAHGAGCGTTATSGATAVSANTLAVERFGAANVDGNRRLAGSCAGDTDCAALAACAGGASCMGAILRGWTTAPVGGLVTAGWRLAEGVSCSVARGGVSMAGLSSFDVYGSTRTPQRSVGSEEYDGACD